MGRLPLGLHRRTHFAGPKGICESFRTELVWPTQVPTQLDSPSVSSTQHRSVESCEQTRAGWLSVSLLKRPREEAPVTLQHCLSSWFYCSDIMICPHHPARGTHLRGRDEQEVRVVAGALHDVHSLDRRLVLHPALRRSHHRRSSTDRMDTWHHGNAAQPAQHSQQAPPTPAPEHQSAGGCKLRELGVGRKTTQSKLTTFMLSASADAPSSWS